jgi:hypothetical protein
MKTIDKIIFTFVAFSFMYFIMLCRPKDSTQPTKVFVVNNQTRPRYDIERVPYLRPSINTRGYTQFSNIGYLYNGNIILPLYGKQTYRGSITWNYYILDPEHHSIKIPLEIENRDCMEEIGCKELYNDDTVFVKAFDKTFKVYMYKPDIYR